VGTLRHAWRSRQHHSGAWLRSPPHCLCCRALSCVCGDDAANACCPSECTSASVATEHCAVMCASSPFSCLGGGRCEPPSSCWQERASAVCAQAIMRALLGSTARPYEASAVTGPHVAARVCQEACWASICDPAQLAVVVVVDGAGIDARRWWTVCMCWRIASVVLRSALVRVPPSVCVAGPRGLWG
jgi:hypothetical protein